MRRQSRHWLPTTDEVATAPELAILASLEATIDVALVALVTAHDELQRSQDGRDAVVSLVGAAADNVIGKAQDLAAAIIAYRMIVCGEIGPLPPPPSRSVA